MTPEAPLKAPLPGAVLVGHLSLSFIGMGRGPAFGMGQDWKQELLPRERIEPLIKEQDEDWFRELAYRILSEDTVIFHVYKADAGAGTARIDFFDCACSFNPKPASTDN